MRCCDDLSVGLFSGITRWMGERLSRYLSQTRHTHGLAAPTDPVRLMACLKPGDVLLEDETRGIRVSVEVAGQRPNMVFSVISNALRLRGKNLGAD